MKRRYWENGRGIDERFEIVENEKRLSKKIPFVLLRRMCVLKSKLRRTNVCACVYLKEFHDDFVLVSDEFDDGIGTISTDTTDAEQWPARVFIIPLRYRYWFFVHFASFPTPGEHLAQIAYNRWRDTFSARTKNIIISWPPYT